MEVAQLALASAVARPLFALLDRVDPAIMESANHERDANAGRTFIEHASATQKALFVGKLLFSYGLGPSRTEHISENLGLGTPTVEAGDDEREVIFLGDLLYVEGLGADSLTPALRARLARADRLVINLEGVVDETGNELFPFQSLRGYRQLAEWNRGDGKGWVIRFAQRELAALLAGLPPVTFTLANNHSLDEGGAGFDRTAALLEGLADHVPGVCKRDASVIVDVGGLSLGLACIGFGNNHRTDERVGLTFAEVPYRLPHELDEHAAKLSSAHLRVATLHWGYEHEHWPRTDQLRCVRELWTRGFQAVVGHHPHLLQPALADARRAVAFSLGDFVGGDRTVFSRFAAGLSLRFTAKGQFRVEVLPLVQTPYLRRQRTALLSEATPFERWVHARTFLPKLRTPIRGAV